MANLKTLKELQDAKLPRCDWRAFLKVEGELSGEDVAALDAHFQHFLPPGPCCKCGEKQGGDVLEQFLGIARFTWDITHGEGYCTTGDCGWPARAYHYDVGPIKKLVIILQYHPEECHERT